MSEVLKNIHGHTTIELTNVHTGEKKIVEDDNTVTNFVDHLLNSAWPTTHPYGNMARGLFPWFKTSSAADRIKDLTQGLMIFNKQIPEDNNFNYLIPGNVTYIGGGTTSAYTGNCLEYGSWNSNEYVDNSNVDGERYVQYTWDFATNQANGKINSVCLTTKANGGVGGGSLLWNDNFYRGYSHSDGNGYAIGRMDRTVGQEPYDRIYTPHPFWEEINYNDYSTNGMSRLCFTRYYPWYDIDRDELLITNQTMMGYGDTTESYTCRYTMYKGYSRYSAKANSYDYFEYYNYCKILTNCTGITTPLTIWKYHTRPNQWDIYSKYPSYNATNDEFAHMLIEKKEFMLPEEIATELKESWQKAHDQLYAAYCAQGKYLYANCYYSDRLFATKDYIYQAFKPFTINEQYDGGWLPNEYIYVWKIKTDLSSSEVIKVENTTTDIVFDLRNVYYKDMSRIFITDNYLFVRALDGVLYMYSFADENWEIIKNKKGAPFKDYCYSSYLFPQRSFYNDRNNTLYISGSGEYGDFSSDSGMGGATLIVRPLIKEGSILNMAGNFLDQVQDCDYNTNSRTCWNYRGLYTYIKTSNPKFIFTHMYIGGYGNGGNDKMYKPCIRHYCFNNPIITTINNLPEEVEKTEDYTMKITYRVSWSDPD